jgi:hypothetical protein
MRLVRAGFRRDGCQQQRNKEAGQGKAGQDRTGQDRGAVSVCVRGALQGRNFLLFVIWAQGKLVCLSVWSGLAGLARGYGGQPDAATPCPVGGQRDH